MVRFLICFIIAISFLGSEANALGLMERHNSQKAGAPSSALVHKPSDIDTNPLIIIPEEERDYSTRPSHSLDQEADDERMCVNKHSEDAFVLPNARVCIVCLNLTIGCACGAISLVDGRYIEDIHESDDEFRDMQEEAPYEFFPPKGLNSKERAQWEAKRERLKEQDRKKCQELFRELLR